MASPSFSLMYCLRTLAGTYRDDARSDAELLSRFTATHDETAFITLAVRHGRLVWSICQRVLGDAQDAEDACQVVFLALAREAGKIHVQDTLAGWLHRVAHRTALNVRREKRSRRKLQERLEAMIPPKAPSESHQDELCEALHDELAKLPEKLRVPLVLHYLEGKTQTEIALILGVKKSTVWDRLTQGKAVVEKRLRRRGIAIGTMGFGALLAEAASQAAMPPGLVGKTVETALTFRAGEPTSGITELARQVLKQAPAAAPWWKNGWMILLMIVGGLGIGAGSAVWKTGLFGNKPDVPPVARTHNEPRGTDKAKRKPARHDFYGDPLPKYALARMGTVRLRQQSSAFHPAVVFSPDGKMLATQSGGWEKKIHVWEARSGRQLLELNDKDEALDEAITFSPDGRRLATANGLFAVRIWESASGKLLRTYEKPTDQKAAANVRMRSLLGMHFSPTGKILVVEEQVIYRENARDKPWKIYVRDAAAGEVVSLKGPPKNTVEAAAFSPDGKLLALGSHLDFREERSFGGAGDIEIDLWKTGTGEKVRQIRIKAERDKHLPEKDPNSYHSTSLRKLAFSPDGNKLAAFKSSIIDVHTESSIYLWEAATGKKINRLAGGEGTGFGRALAFSPDGKQLVGGSGRLWNAATGDRIRLFDWEEVSEAAYSPTGKIIATVEQTGQIRLWDVDAGKEVGPRPGLHVGVKTIVYSSDGKTLVGESAWPENMLRWWEVGTGKELNQRRAGAGNEGAIFSSDGKIRLTKDNVDTGRPLMPEQRLTLSDLDGGKELGFFREEHNLDSVPAFSLDGKKLAMIGVDGTVHVWNTDAREQIYKLGAGDKRSQSPFRVTFSPDGKLLAASGVGATVVFWEMATGGVAGSLAEHELRAGRERIPGRPDAASFPAESVCPMLFSPDGRMLVTMTAWTNGRGSCELRDAAHGRKIYQLPGGMFQGRCWPCFAFSKDGRLLAVAGAPEKDSAVHLVDALSGEEIGRLDGHQAKVNTLVFSPDGATLASCSDDATCLIWDATGFAPAQGRLAASNRQRAKQLSEKELEMAWRDLSLDSAKAYRAIWNLSAAPAQAVALLQNRIRPAASLTEPRQLDRWIADLDSNQFAVRQKALRGIEDLGEAAAPHLRQALKGKLPIEARRQVQESLGKVKTPLREIRAVQVLEYIGTPAARKTLQNWAQGLCEAKLTQDAQAALTRLAKRTAGKP